MPISGVQSYGETSETCIVPTKFLNNAIITRFATKRETPVGGNSARDSLLYEKLFIKIIYSNYELQILPVSD